MTGRSSRALARRWVLGTLAVLVACVGTAALAPAAWPGSALMAATLLLPLLLPVRGLLRGDRRTHAWATMCVAPCFLYGVTETVANPSLRGVAAAILFASLAHFVALVAYLRVTRPQAAGPDIQRP